MAKKRITRSAEITPPDVVFPSLQCFKQPTKLPLTNDVIGVMRGLQGLKVAEKHPMVADSAKTVATMIYSKYHHDTVYCISFKDIKVKVEKDWETFRKGKKRILEGRTSGNEVNKYLKLAKEAGKLYDVDAKTEARKKKCYEEWGIKMSDNDKSYLLDQKNDRLKECDNGIDPVWWSSEQRKLREQSRKDQWKEEKEEQFMGVEGHEVEDCTVVVSCGGEQEEELVLRKECSEEEEISDYVESDPESVAASSKRRKFHAIRDDDNDPLPKHMRHVRNSERQVRDEIYECLADLEGFGLSAQESMKALVRVAELFNRKWKLLGEDEDSFDVDTLPHEKNLRVAAQQIEAKGMACMVEELRNAKDEGRMLTHATDSTTKREVGKFSVSGIHIGQNVPFPLPLIPVCGETTEDIAEQCKLIFEILAVVDGKTPDDLYSELVDTHMTDSTEHNKGFASLLASMFNLDTVKGQLFCGTHTTLGFSGAMNKILAVVERDMTLEAIFQNFMVDLDFDSKHGSVAGQACDVQLRLVAPEFHHKSWNYYKDFLEYLKSLSVELVLFAYKDQRFGCLSRAAAVLLYIKNYLSQWLEKNPHITNRLACIVRDFLGVEYLDVAFAVFATYGIQLIEPFFVRTIDKEANHSTLKVFYKALHDRMAESVTDDFFTLCLPWFDCVSEDLFTGVIESYNKDVVEAVKSVSEMYMEQCVALANLMMPELKVVLARQRRDYGLSEEFKPEYPVEQQASMIDDTPVHNLGMERLCGLVGYRAKKLQDLEAVSRSIILDSSGKLRKDSEISFRSFRKQTNEVKKLKLQWSESMKEKFSAKLDEKQAVALTEESKRLDLLEELKMSGGPFTTSQQVDEYLALAKTREECAKNNTQKKKFAKETKTRMKSEVTFARDSSTILPRVDPLFRIQVSIPGKPRRDKTAEEFGEALKVLFGKRAGKRTLT